MKRSIRKCPYCDSEVSYLEALSQVSTGEHTCSVCNKNSNITYDKKIYIPAAILLAIAVIATVLMFLLDAKTNLLLAFVIIIIPFAVFFFMTPLYFKLHPIRSEAQTPVVKYRQKSKRRSQITPRAVKYEEKKRLEKEQKNMDKKSNSFKSKFAKFVKTYIVVDDDDEENDENLGKFTDDDSNNEKTAPEVLGLTRKSDITPPEFDEDDDEPIMIDNEFEDEPEYEPIEEEDDEEINIDTYDEIDTVDPLAEDEEDLSFISVYTDKQAYEKKKEKTPVYHKLTKTTNVDFIYLPDSPDDEDFITITFDKSEAPETAPEAELDDSEEVEEILNFFDSEPSDEEEEEFGLKKNEILIENEIEKGQNSQSEPEKPESFEYEPEKGDTLSVAFDKHENDNEAENGSDPEENSETEDEYDNFRFEDLDYPELETTAYRNARNKFAQTKNKQLSLGETEGEPAEVEEEPEEESDEIEEPDLIPDENVVDNEIIGEVGKETEITTDDPFFSETNMERLRNSVAQMEQSATLELDYSELDEEDKEEAEENEIINETVNSVLEEDNTPDESIDDNSEENSNDVQAPVEEKNNSLEEKTRYYTSSDNDDEEESYILDYSDSENNEDTDDTYDYTYPQAYGGELDLSEFKTSSYVESESIDIDLNDDEEEDDEEINIPEDTAEPYEFEEPTEVVPSISAPQAPKKNENISNKPSFKSNKIHKNDSDNKLPQKSKNDEVPKSEQVGFFSKIKNKLMDLTEQEREEIFRQEENERKQAEKEARRKAKEKAKEQAEKEAAKAEKSKVTAEKTEKKSVKSDNLMKSSKAEHGKEVEKTVKVEKSVKADKSKKNEPARNKELEKTQRFPAVSEGSRVAHTDQKTKVFEIPIQADLSDDYSEQEQIVLESVKDTVSKIEDKKITEEEKVKIISEKNKEEKRQEKIEKQKAEQEKQRVQSEKHKKNKKLQKERQEKAEQLRQTQVKKAQESQERIKQSTEKREMNNVKLKEVGKVRTKVSQKQAKKQQQLNKFFKD